MPIYAYRCADCGHTKDVLQKLSDPVLTTCPACGKDTFSKQLTAAGFQLKGSGWYVTDFRGGNNANGAAKSSSASSSGEAKSESPKTEGPSASSGGSDSAGSCGTACACH
jgi:putative FmdB family regulatory protein